MLFSGHRTTQIHRVPGNALLKKSHCIWCRTQQTKQKPVFLKADLCQQGNPHTVCSSIVLILTELLHLVEVKNLVPHMWDSLLMLIQLSLLCLGKFCFCLFLFTLYGLATLQMHCLSPFFDDYSCSAVCCCLCELWYHGPGGSEGTAALVCRSFTDRTRAPVLPWFVHHSPHFHLPAGSTPKLGLLPHTKSLL